jgi:hypothetical protein
MMMRERKIAVLKTSVPWALLAAIVLFGVFEGMNAVWDEHFYTTETRTTQAIIQGLEGLRMKIKNDYAQRRDNSFDGLVLGDSYYISGVLPNLLGEKLGRDVFNFSGFGDQGVFAAYCLFKNYVRAHPGRPSWIIIGFQPDTLSRPRIDPGLMYDLRKGNAWAMIGEYGLSEGLKLQIPSLKHQHVWRGVMKYGQWPRTTLNKKQITAMIQDVLKNKGFYSPYPFQAVAEPAGEKDLNPFYHFRVTQPSWKNLRGILDLAGKHHIQVFYLRPTYSEDWRCLYERQGVIKDYAAFLERLKELYPGIIILDYQQDIHSLSLYSDRLHLNLNGARLLNQKLAEDIREFLESPSIKE